ncbi:MAG: tail fiber domain-containing protein [Verrucomicrobiota bacterium]
MKTTITRTLLALVLLLTPQLPAFGQETAFTYQGELASGGNAANGVYDFSFALWNAASGGAQQGATFATNAVAVSNGYFVVTMDFGNQFDGNARWLEIAVRTSGPGAFSTLSPRQQLTPAPYAIFANTASNLSGTLPAAQMSPGTANISITGNAATVTHGVYDNGSYTDPAWIASLAGSKIVGDIGGDANTVDGLHAADFWQLQGNNAGPGNFLGTLNNQPLELRVNNTGGLRLEYNVNAPNVIAGFSGNIAVPGVAGAAIGGGGQAGNINGVGSDYATIGGGAANAIGPSSGYSTISGGQNNAVQFGDLNSTIAGGVNNTIQSNNWYSTISGGGQNTISNTAWYAAIHGGGGNIIGTNAWWSVIGGGAGNLLGPNATFSLIAGGDWNTIQSNAVQAVIGGGTGNLIMANANEATIPGGSTNVIGSSAAHSTIAGGEFNNVGNSAQDAAIGGGYLNVVQTGASMSTIAGGNANVIEPGSMDSAVGGGFQNVIHSNTLAATIGGGGLNQIMAGANYSVIPGGANNVVGGSGSLAAGQNALAMQAGTFVWADSTPGPFGSTASNQFLVRATGGVGIGTTSPAAALHVGSTGSWNNPQALFEQQNGDDAVRLRLAATGAAGWDIAVQPGPTGSLGFWMVGAGQKMGITSDGQVLASAFAGDGSALSGITAGSIASGAVVKTLNGLTDDIVLAAGANITLTTNGNTLTLAAGGGGGGGWSLTGNAGTTTPANFLGTTDNNPLELWVNNRRAFRLEPNTNAANVIGGFKYNSVLAGVHGATIAGGGEIGYTNMVNSDEGAIGGGSGHRIDTNSQNCTIAGGSFNTIRSNTYAATIAGGYMNTVGSNAPYAVIGGGSHNADGAEGSTIAGGEMNSTANQYSTVSGGVNDAATNYAATVAGGYVNTAGGQYSAVGGGQQNIASGDNSVIPGGSLNLAAGAGSFAAGSQAQAVNNGAFVWADSQAGAFASTANNQVSFRCVGGVRFTSGALTANQTVSWAPGNSSWSFTSDRNTKENFTPVDGEEILEKLSSLALSEWSYQGYPQRHIGPMAQDFHALFPLNDTETMLNDTDLHGVALAAIQGLNKKLEETVKQKDTQIADLERRLAALEQLVKSNSTGGQ